MADTSHIRSTIKARRQELRISQDEMGNVLGITGVSYGRLENGVSKFNVEQLQLVCDKLGLDFEDLSSALPMQAKTAPVPVTEYTKVVNEYLDLQKRYNELKAEIDQAEQERKQALPDIIKILEGMTGPEADILREAVGAIFPAADIHMNNKPRSRS